MSNYRAWLSALISVVASLGVSALLLWLMLPLLDSFDAAAAEPLRLEARDFETALAAAVLADARGEGVPRPGRGDTVLRAYPRFRAEDYPFFQLDLDGVDETAEVFLFWRTVGSSDQLHVLPLGNAGDGMGWYAPGSDPAWQGTINELSVGAFGGSERGIPALESLALRSASRATTVERLWWQWTRFEPWQMSTINVYSGAGRDTPLRPTAAAGAWLLLAAPFLWLAAWRLKWPRPVWLSACLVLVFIPWFGLDRLWQAQLDRQLEVTKNRFGGLAQAGKHEREMDADLQQYAERLKRRLPAVSDTRLFLLHDSVGHNFWRLRMQYHLLPYNIYNYGRRLQSAGTFEAGDFILVLEAVEGLRFDADSGRLSDGEHRIAVERMDRHPSGTLFRVSGEAGRADS